MNEPAAPGGSTPLGGTTQEWVRRGLIVWTIIGIGIVAFGAWNVVSLLMGALTPFILGGVLAYLMRPMVRFLCARGLGRGLATAVTVFIGFFLVAALAVVVTPLLAANIVAFINTVPRYWNQLQLAASRLVDSVAALPLPVRNVIDQALTSSGDALRTAATGLAQVLVGAGGFAVVIGFNFFVGFVLAIWFLVDGHNVAKWAVWVLPPALRDDAVAIGLAFNDSFGGYLLGTLFNVATTFVGCGIGFALIGLPYGWIIAFVIGVLAVIPYVGPIAGGIVASLVGLTVSPLTALLTLAIVVAVEQLVDTVVSPFIMGRAVSLHPVAIIFALAVGGALAGFFGVLVSIPVAAALYTVYLYYAERHLTPYDGDPASVAGPESSEENA